MIDAGKFWINSKLLHPGKQALAVAIFEQDYSSTNPSSRIKNARTDFENTAAGASCTKAWP